MIYSITVLSKHCNWQIMMSLEVIFITILVMYSFRLQTTPRLTKLFNQLLVLITITQSLLITWPSQKTKGITLLKQIIIFNKQSETTIINISHFLIQLFIFINTPSISLALITSNSLLISIPILNKLNKCSFYCKILSHFSIFDSLYLFSYLTMN